MFCSHCGEPQAEDAIFCSACGSRVRGDAAVATMPPPSDYYAGRIEPLHRTAGFGPRFGAWILDIIFSSVLALIAAIALAILFGAMAALGQGDASTLAEQADRDAAIENAAFAGAYLGWFIAYYAYHWIGTSLGGAWGKRIVGLRVVNFDTGAAPGWGSGFLRVLISVFSGIFYLGYLWSLWDSERRTWHDHAANTTVVHVR